MPTYRSFQFSFHDSSLLGVQMGPRRDLSLSIDLDPAWNPGGGAVKVNFDAVENFAEVKEFFSALEDSDEPEAYLAEITGLEYDRMAGRGGLKRVVVDLGQHGPVEIDCRLVTTLGPWPD